MDTIIFAACIAALLAVSEALSFIPGVKANGVFQAIWNVLKMIAGENPKKEG